MIARIARCTSAELSKISLHPFFYFSVALLVLLIPTWAHLEPQLTGKADEGVLHAVQIFAYGAKPGFKIATFIILILTSMMFAGEFDRGTIKVLLTRPLTRTDLFLAKCISAVALVAFFLALVLYLSAVTALAGGELGPVWKADVSLDSTPYEVIAGHARTAVLLSLLPTFAAAFLGIFVSNLTESSGYAVAAGLVLYLVLDLTGAVLPAHAAQYLFNFYPDHAFTILKRFGEGASTFWFHQREESHLFLLVPLASIAVFASVAYARFRTRDITV